IRNPDPDTSCMFHVILLNRGPSMYVQASGHLFAQLAVAYSKCHHPMIENELPSLEDIREFTHRVKSVSMAKFTSQEVSALQGGGNASAKEIYFKEWDAQRQSFPDSSNVERLRDFIKHVYVDRRYSGERSLDKPPRAKTKNGGIGPVMTGRRTSWSAPDRQCLGEVEGSRSPPYENERRFSDRPSPGGRSDGSSRNSYDERRSPGYDQDFKKSPARTDVVNDWRREDRFGNGRRSDDGGSKVEGRSPDRQSNPDMSSPPIVRPVREILGDSVSPLRVLEPPKANGSRPAVGSFQTQACPNLHGLELQLLVKQV
ncbi:probable ADP-ribosylation factor GTPase-activating protein AGD14 isoform X1, partial [Tanacetum coccineum]